MDDRETPHKIAQSFSAEFEAQYKLVAEGYRTVAGAMPLALCYVFANETQREFAIEQLHSRVEFSEAWRGAASRKMSYRTEEINCPGIRLARGVMFLVPQTSVGDLTASVIAHSMHGQPYLIPNPADPVAP